MKRILLSVILVSTLFACTKPLDQSTELSTSASPLSQGKSDNNKDKEKNCGAKNYTYAQLLAKGKPVHPIKGPKNKNDTTPPPPPPPPNLTTGVLLLDFDGYSEVTSSWGPITATPSGLSADGIADVVRRVQEDYAPFNVKVTTDETLFYAAAADRRMRCVVGSGMAPYFGQVGGIAYIGSLTWGTDDPCFVLSDLLNYNTKNVAEAASHEFGHTISLQHQSDYDASCVKTAEYSTGLGTGNLSFAPLMGVGYYRNVTGWIIGKPTTGCNNTQDDIAIISSYLPIKADDVPISVNITPGVVKGILETQNDVDTYTLPSGSYNISVVSGGNADIAVEVIVNGVSVGTYDDGADISVTSFFQVGVVTLRVKTSDIASLIPKYSSRGQYTINIQ